MSEGYVYILSNESMPGLVKIGRSISSGRNRAKEIYQTGVPTPFTLEFEIYADDCVELETDVHQRLDDYRVNKNREFFRLEVRQAIKELTSEYLCRYDLTVQHSDLIVDEEGIYQIDYLLRSEGICLFPPEIALVITNIQTSDLIKITHDYFERKNSKAVAREDSK